jgi:ATP-dependent RNA helicase MRH4
MSNAFDGDGMEGEFEVRPGSGTGHTLDVLVGTPSTVLAMTRGGRWDKNSTVNKERRQNKWSVGRPEVNFSGIEWVVVDEADVLFGTHAS